MSDSDQLVDQFIDGERNGVDAIINKVVNNIFVKGMQNTTAEDEIMEVLGSRSRDLSGEEHERLADEVNEKINKICTKLTRNVPGY
jgi:hypothetical protein